MTHKDNSWPHQAANRLVFVLCLFFSGIGFAMSENPKPQLDPTQNVAQYLSCMAAQEITLVSAHRGGPRPGLPENALESMQAAIAHGAMLLEVDVRETADGELILLHDNTLERTTTGSGALAGKTLSELSKINLVDNEGQPTEFTVPTLVSALEWAKDRAILQLDVKRGIDYRKVAQAVVAADAIDSVLIVAYQLEDLLTSLSVDNRLSFSYSINDSADLQALDNAGIPRLQVVAWTGVIEQQAKPIWPVLESLDIPFATGAFWHLEKQIIQTGDTQPYLDLSEAGVDVVASDHYWLAYDTLTTSRDMAAAVNTCSDQ